MRTAYLYIHKKKNTNEIFYIGIGRAKNFSRAYVKAKRNPLWLNTVSKYGYDIEIIYSNLTWEEACNLEKALIKFYGRRDLKLGNLCNMTDGGDGNNNIVFTEEHRRKISLAQTGKKWSKRIPKLINEVKVAVIDIEKNIIYKSITEAANDNNLTKSTLSRYLKGLRKNKTNLRYYEYS